jgi:hypothetical protein
MELNPNCLPYDTIHIPGFRGEDACVMELDVCPKPMLCSTMMTCPDVLTNGRIVGIRIVPPTMCIT